MVPWGVCSRPARARVWLHSARTSKVIWGKSDCNDVARLPDAGVGYNRTDMTPETILPPEPQPKRMGELSRIMGVLFEPAKTFEDIARRPSWVVPWLLLLLLGQMGLVFDYALDKRVGFDRVMQQQMESRLSQMSPEQRATAERGMEMQKKFAGIGYYGFALIGPILGGLIVAGVLTGIVGGILSAGVKFKQVLAIFFYSGVAQIIWSLLAIVVMFLKPPEDFNFRNPLAFNPGAFMDPASSSKFLYALATSLDVFTFWRIFLIAVGLKAAAGKKLSMGGAVAAVALPWAVLALIGSAVAGMFG
jgi:hypothetical protein